MAYNKVEYNGETLIDLTDTTASKSDVAQGKKFHDRSGALREGNLVPQTYTAGTGIDITNDEISAKCDGTTIQTNANGDLEVKPNVYEEKKTWTTLLTATTTEDAVFQLDDTSAGVNLNDYSEIEVIWNLPSGLTGRPHFNWYYNNAYAQDITASLNASDCHYGILHFFKKMGIWWAECFVSDTQTRLNIVHKSVYRDGITNLVMASFEGARIFISRSNPTVNDFPSGTKIFVRGLK